MAKKDNRGGPIEFRTTSGPGGRHNVPIPINRPNWKYGGPASRSRPTIYEWMLIGLSISLIAAFSFILIPKGGWALSLFLALVPILWIISAISRQRYYSAKVENGGKNKSTKKREKKFPKHHKDYK